MNLKKALPFTALGGTQKLGKEFLNTEIPRANKFTTSMCNLLNMYWTTRYSTYK